MLSNAFALAVLTTAGFVIIYKKLPRKVRRFIEKYSLAADIIALMSVYLLLGGTLTALIAGAMCGLFISAMLHIANNQDNYLFLYDLRDLIKEKLHFAREALEDYGKKYRENKHTTRQDGEPVSKVHAA